MKNYPFNLGTIIHRKVFPHIRIKTKAQIIEILMEAVRFILLQNDSDFIIEDTDAVGKMIIYIDKMSRIFFFTDKKYYSIVFPFHILKENDKYKIVFKSDIEVTSQLISKVISIIKCDEFKEQCGLDFIMPICDAEDDCDENFWEFLRELLLMEDGYIRYDYDEEHQDENFHPLNHYDLFYSSKATFKIGLNGELSYDNFLDFLDINSNCKYLH